MLLDPYFNETNKTFNVSRDQGSSFAKQLANDFNPLHDIDAKRFVVPGDLLFSLVLQQKGLSKDMRFDFGGMVNEETQFQMVEADEGHLSIEDTNEKQYLSVERSGEVNDDQTVISALIKEYVQFSGKTFPHILVPLMKEQNAMINPARPMVMYQSMAIHITESQFTAPTLEVAKTEFTANGKRGDVHLHFNLISEGKIVGRGEKNMVLSGLREYDQDAIDKLVADYDARKSA